MQRKLQFNVAKIYKFDIFQIKLMKAEKRVAWGWNAMRMDSNRQDLKSAR